MLQDLGLLVMRLIAGGIFAAHGYPKLFGGPEKQVSPSVTQYLGQGFAQLVQHGSPQQFAATVERVGAPQPMAMAWFVAFLEFAGGIMLALGWMTRPVAMLLAGEMAFAVAKVHWRNGLVGQGGFEFPLSLLGSCLALLGTGPGALSLDGARSDAAREAVEAET